MELIVIITMSKVQSWRFSLKKKAELSMEITALVGWKTHERLCSHAVTTVGSNILVFIDTSGNDANIKMVLRTSVVMRTGTET